MASDVLAVTWWGHASATVEIGGRRIALDPLLGDRLFHLRRYAVTPVDSAVDADLVLVSHLHHDHCHLPSLLRVAPEVPVVLPRGGERLLRRRPDVRPVTPGEVVDVNGVSIAVLSAFHDGRRLPWSRYHGPALGFRIGCDDRSVWYPGDTGPQIDFGAIEAVDLALVPVGGWGHSLGDEHLNPDQAADAVSAVGARWVVPVHWGTFFPRGLALVARRTHQRMFVTPGQRFADTMRGRGAEAVVLVPGQRVVL